MCRENQFLVRRDIDTGIDPEVLKEIRKNGASSYRGNTIDVSSSDFSAESLYRLAYGVKLKKILIVSSSELPRFQLRYGARMTQAQFIDKLLDEKIGLVFADTIEEFKTLVLHLKTIQPAAEIFRIMTEDDEMPEQLLLTQK